MGLLALCVLAMLAMEEEPPKHGAAIEVIGVTPIDGVGIDRAKFPTNAHRVTLAEGDAAADALLERAAGVETNDPQGAPLQPDVQFRGFSVSPLLGAPEGLALYLDGVRLNEPFGDTVSWSSVPSSALESIEVIPGANPVFGLNALGGALSMRTHSAATHTSALLRGGSFGRLDGEVSTGGERWFVAASHLRERGWRDFSPGHATQLFARTGAVRLTLARSTLTGNGAAPEALLAEDRAAVFTHPDETRNATAMLSASHQRAWSAATFGEAAAYVRHTRTRTFNGDAGAPVEGFDASNHRTRLAQTAFGATVQVDRSGTLARRANRWIAGASLDGGAAHFRSSTELAHLTEDRGTAGSGILDPDSLVDLTTRSRTLSAFVADILTATPRLTVIATARLNHVRMRLDDHIDTALDGTHSFTQLHPSLGAALELGRGMSAFANAGLTGRTPTPVELSCADPEDPCRLPNAFVSDPPLRAVTGRTFEIGLRGARGPVSWSGAVHRSASEDDLLFISSGPLRGHGHFANVGTTVRQGLELAASGRAGARVRWSASYAMLDAYFATPLTVPAPNHPEAVDGEVPVERGDRLPLVPRHAGKLSVDVDLSPRLTAGASLRAVSRQFFRGDEGNLAEPLPAYAVADARLDFRLGDRTSLGLEMRNLLDAEYATFGTFGDAEEVLGEEYEDHVRFVTPAAPRAVTVSVKARF